MPNRIFVTGTLLMLLTGCAGQAEKTGKPSPSGDASNVAPTTAQITKTVGKQPPKKVDISNRPYQGQKDAPITLVGFSDLHCKYCAEFAFQTLPLLERKYIKTGKLQFVFRDLPIVKHHPKAFEAAEAAHCAAEQDKFWPMHDLLLSSPNRGEHEDLMRLANTLGLDKVKFEDCLEDTRYDANIEQDIEDAKVLKVFMTPSFFLGYTPTEGEPLVVESALSGAMSIEVFSNVIDTLLRRAGIETDSPQ